jgi:hypothetical protein
MKRGRKPGSPKTGGRKKGTKNKRTLVRLGLAKEAAETGVTPLAFLLAVMRDETRPPAERLEAAKSAAPYMHPRLAAIEHSGNQDKPLAITIVTGVPRASDDAEAKAGKAA